MNYLIIYMSHHGTTQKVVNELKEKLGASEITVVNLATDEVPDLLKFHTIIVGGSIHMGKIQWKVSKFCEDHYEQLMQKRLGLFLCFMNKKEGQKEFENAFSEELRKHAAAHGLFGGELLFDKMSFIEKLMTKKVSGINHSVSDIDEEAVKDFAEEMQEV